MDRFSDAGTSVGKNGKTDDGTIISLFWKRDEHAVEATREKYGRLCRSVAKNIVGDERDAEECENDVYVRLWNSIPPEMPDNLPGFICRIARNLAIDKIKKSRAEKRNAAVSLMGELEECFPSRDDVETVLDKMALTRAFERFLASETPVNRMIFMRRYFYLDSTGDIARLMKMTGSGVRVSLYRIRRRLAKFLADEGMTI